jgi:hypothetical protein
MSRTPRPGISAETRATDKGQTAPNISKPMVGQLANMGAKRRFVERQVLYNVET